MAAPDSTPFFLLSVGTSKRPNLYAKISPEDAELALRYKWSITRGTDRNGPYYVRAIDRTSKPVRQVKLHRLIMDAPAGTHVDHINGDPLDNRRCNLRIATPQQNQCNSRKHKRGTSTFKGVSRNRDSGRWRAYIVKDRKQINLGSFATELEAADAYDKAALAIFGEFACLNLR